MVRPRGWKLKVDILRKNSNDIRDSVPRCKGRALLLFTNVVGQPTWSMDGGQIHELSVHNFDLTESTKKKEEPHLRNDLVPCHVTSLTSVCLSSKVGGRRFLTSVRMAATRKDECPERRQIVQQATSTGETRNKAGCFPLLRRITRLKCVNSVVRTVNSLPKRGSLKWVHGTMSEPPWKSH